MPNRINIQSPNSDYTIRGLRRRISALFVNNDLDEAQRVSSIFVEAWLQNLAYLSKADWDVFVDEHQDWHVRVKRRTRHVSAYRGAVTVPRTENLGGTHYRDMFMLIAEEHNLKIHGRYFAPTKMVSTFPQKLVKKVEVRGKVFMDKKEDTVKAMDDMALQALTPEDMDEQATVERMAGATVVELLGQGNFRVRG